jgi:hypothetical protein
MVIDNVIIVYVNYIYDFRLKASVWQLINSTSNRYVFTAVTISLIIQYSGNMPSELAHICFLEI